MRSQMSNDIGAGKNKYREIFNESPYVIFLLDREGKVLDINKAAQKVFGCDENEFPDFGNRNFFSSDDEFNLLKDSLQFGKEFSGSDFSFVSKSGKKIPCVLTISVLDKEQRIYLGICNDNAARKKREAGERATDRFNIVARV